MSLVRSISKRVWAPLLELSAWATRTERRGALVGRPLERALGAVTLAAKGAARRSSVGEVAREWQRMMPSPRMVPIVQEDERTVVAEIRAACPYRGTGNVAGCHRMMEYDRRMLETIGGQLVVLRSQAEPGVTTCLVAIRQAGRDLADLEPAHERTAAQPTRPR
jgi:hypothetical protein